MDLIDKIKSLASGAADMTLQQFNTDRVGAEAERRGLFAAWMRNATNETLTDLLRERNGLFSRIGDDELRTEFAERGLHDGRTEEATKALMLEAAREVARAELNRVRVLRDEVIERLKEL